MPVGPGGSRELLLLDPLSNGIRVYTNSETAQRHGISPCQAGLVWTSVVGGSGGRLIIHKHWSRLKRPHVSRMDSLGVSSSPCNGILLLIHQLNHFCAFSVERVN